MHRVAALGLESWFPLLETNDTLARATFLNTTAPSHLKMDHGEHARESDGMALIWDLAESNDSEAQLTAARAASKVASMGFEGIQSLFCQFQCIWNFSDLSH